jgi:hypothetical protein
MTNPLDVLDLMTRGAYDLQKLRIQTGLRLCAQFHKKLKDSDIESEPEDEGLTTNGIVREDGVESDVPDLEGADSEEEEDDPEKKKKKETEKKAKKIINRLKKEYKRLTDGVARNRTLPRREGFTGTGVVSEFAELVMIHEYLELEKQERVQFRYIEEELITSGLRVYDDWLREQVGIGPALASILLTRYDIIIAERPSQFFALAGLDVGPGIATDPNNKLARSRRAEHLIDREYKAKDGTMKTKKSTTFDPWLQAKLLGVLGPSLMKARSPYKEHYDRYKHKIQTDPNRRKGTLAQKKKEWSEGKKTEEIWHKNRIHRASMRYMVKQFIGDFWRQWREAEGLPTVPPYHEAILGHQHYESPKKGRNRPPEAAE